MLNITPCVNVNVAFRNRILINVLINVAIRNRILTSSRLRLLQTNPFILFFTQMVDVLDTELRLVHLKVSVSQ